MIHRPSWISFLILLTVVFGVVTTGAHAQVDSSTPPAWFQPSEGAPIADAPAGQLQAAIAGALQMYVPIVDVLLIEDVYPWAYNSNEIALAEAGVSYAVISSAELSSTDLSGVRVLMYASDQPTWYYTNLAPDMDKIEDFVARGGVLIAHACDFGWQGGLWEGYLILPGSVGHTVGWDYLTQYLEIVDPFNPLVMDLEDSYFWNWNWSAHGFLTSLPNGAQVIMQAAPGRPTYAQYQYGSGWVLATVQTVEWGYGDGVNYHYVYRPELLRREISYATSGLLSGGVAPGTPIYTTSPYDPALSGQLHRLKGQMHCHWYCDFGNSKGLSWWRDRNALTPDELVAQYANDQGYDFVCVTEHNHATRDAASGSTFSMKYCEEATQNPHPHVIAVGIDGNSSPGQDIPIENNGSGADPMWDDSLNIKEIAPSEDAQSVINGVVAMGGLALLPHPPMVMDVSLRELRFLGTNFTLQEILALGPNGQNLSNQRPSALALRTAAINAQSEGLWDDLLKARYGKYVNVYGVTRRLPIFGYAEDDYTPGVPLAHGVCGATWVVVNAYYDEGASVGIKRASVRDALARGDFVAYWTENNAPWNGDDYPKLNVWMTTENNVPVIHAATAGQETLDEIKFITKDGTPFKTDRRRYFKRTSEASYTCTGNESYVRILCKYDPSVFKPDLYIATQPILVYPKGVARVVPLGAAPVQMQGVLAAATEASPSLQLDYVEPDAFPDASPRQGYIGFVYNVTCAVNPIPAGTNLELSYAGQAVSAVGRENLCIFRYHQASHLWVRLDSTVDPTKATVLAPISEPGLYALSAELPLDNEPPLVTIDSPAESALVSGTITVAAHAEDNVGVLRADFYINGRQVGYDGNPSDGCTCDIDTSHYESGQHELTVEADDVSGNRGSASRGIQIASSTTPLGIQIISPANGDSVSGLVTVGGTYVSDRDVSEIDVLIDGRIVQLATKMGGNWEATIDSWPFGGGTREVGALIRDYYGNAASTSVQVTMAGDTTPPAISLTPATGIGLVDAKNPMSLNALATDLQSGVASVTATVNGSPVALPFQISSPGTYHLVVTATDNAGNSATRAADYTVYRLVWLPPIVRGNTFPFQVGSTLPVKLSVQDSNGRFVNGLVLVLTCVGPAPSTSSRWSGPAPYTYDKQPMYKANVSTKGWPLGTYSANVSGPGISSPARIGFTLRKGSVSVLP